MKHNDFEKNFIKFKNDNQEDKSLELFNKSTKELTEVEQAKLERYLYELMYPTYKPVRINGIPTMYIVSSTGIIKNKFTGKEIKPHLHYKGYWTISLQFGGNGKNITTFVHRVVAQAFIPNPENKPQVNHINGNKFCNWYENLEWCTCSENIQHAVKEGLFYAGMGEDANASKYSDEQIHKTCKLLESNAFSIVEISKYTNVDVSTISKIRNGKEWQHIASQYKIKRIAQNAKGAESASSKYSEDQIHQVCKMLASGNYTSMQIARETKVGYDMIGRIKRGQNWTDISSQYGIVPKTK